MASSQVEIASSSSPFGCILRDHNRDRGGGGVSNNGAAAAVAFNKNLKELVRDHLHTCISVSPNNKDENNAQFKVNHHHGNIQCAISRDGNDNDDSTMMTMSKKQAKLLDRWAAKQAKEMVSELKEDDCASACGNENLAASSLVQIWEARLNNPSKPTLNRSHSMSNKPIPSTSVSVPCSSSSSVENDKPLTNAVAAVVDNNLSDKDDSSSSSSSSLDCESTGTTSLVPSRRNSDAEGESEKLRVVDIIRRLTSEDHGEQQGGESPRRVERRLSSCSSSDQAESQRGLLPQLVSSPRIRGRQAFHDLILQMEKERHMEVDSLAQRHAVSKFSQRGRIQTLLRIRLMQRGIAIQDQQRALPQPQSSRSTTASDYRRPHTGSSITHLRERFSTGAEQATTALNDVANTSRSAETGNSSTQMVVASTVPNDTANISRSAETANSSTRMVIASTAPNAETANSSTQMVVASTAPNDAANTSMSAETANSSTQMVVASTAPNDAANTSRSAETVNSSTQMVGASIHNQLNEGSNHHQEISTTKLQGTPEKLEESSVPQKSKLQRSPEKEEEGAMSHTGEACKDAHEETNAAAALDIENLGSRETSQTSPSLNAWDENEIEDEEQEEEETEEANELQNFEDTIDDWFSSIARPRSYWEDRRQAWYQEFLSTTSDNNEIRKLLERRTVSTFLSSDFRNKMDQLMVSRTQIQAIHQDEEIDEDSQERMGQLMLSYFQRNSHSASNQRVDGREEEPAFQQYQQHHLQPPEGGGEEEEESTTSCRYIEATDYLDQSPSINSPSPLRSWNYNDHNVASDESERVAVTPSCLPEQPKASNQDRQSSPLINHPSIEMGLIYDLRGHMEQLQREMSQLRRSIQSCMEMQVKFQGCCNLIAQPVRREERNAVERTERKRICCICYGMQVDSFLYRCGHMCTCHKCAQELQWGSGKCPICRAPILDVVRAYLPDS